MADKLDPARMQRLLEIEFEYLQKANDKFDGSRFVVKNWAVATGGTTLALSITSARPILAVIGIAVVLMFGYIETLYIYMQDAVIARCNYIEHLLDAASRNENPPGDKDYRFGIRQAFASAFDIKGVARALIGRPHIYVLYLVLLAALAADVALIAL